MAAERRVYFSHECDAAAERVGGYSKIDDSLNAAYDAIVRNPYGFPRVESDWYSARYIVTKPFFACPALIWLFVIETNGDVVLNHVEVFDGY